MRKLKWEVIENEGILKWMPSRIVSELQLNVCSLMALIFPYKTWKDFTPLVFFCGNWKNVWGLWQTLTTKWIHCDDRYHIFFSKKRKIKFNRLQSIFYWRHPQCIKFGAQQRTDNVGKAPARRSRGIRCRTRRAPRTPCCIGSGLVGGSAPTLGGGEAGLCGKERGGGSSKKRGGDHPHCCLNFDQHIFPSPENKKKLWPHHVASWSGWWVGEPPGVGRRGGAQIDI